MGRTGGLGGCQIAEVSLEEKVERPQGKSHDVVIISLNPFHKKWSGVVLNPVPAGLVHRSSRLYVGLNFSVGEGREGDVCRRHSRCYLIGFHVVESDSGMYSVSGVAQTPEHLSCVFMGLWLPKDVFVVGHKRIGGQDEGLWMSLGYGFDLATGQSLDRL